MKKSFAVVLMALLLLSFSLIQAQTNFSLGVKAGSNFGNLSFDPDVNSQTTKSSVTGFASGAVAEISFIPMLALQIEPTYLTGGSSLSGPLFSNGATLINGKITFNITYLSIPILLKLKIPIPKSEISPYAFLGPNIGFLLSSKEKDEPNGFPSSEIDQKDFMSSTNFSLEFGVGAGYKVTPQTTITFDGRYSLGLSNILNDKGKQNLGVRE